MSLDGPTRVAHVILIFVKTIKTSSSSIALVTGIIHHGSNAIWMYLWLQYFTLVQVLLLLYNNNYTDIYRRHVPAVYSKNNYQVALYIRVRVPDRKSVV